MLKLGIVVPFNTVIYHTILNSYTDVYKWKIIKHKLFDRTSHITFYKMKKKA